MSILNALLTAGTQNEDAVRPPAQDGPRKVSCARDRDPVLVVL